MLDVLQGRATLRSELRLVERAAGAAAIPQPLTVCRRTDLLSPTEGGVYPAYPQREDRFSIRVVSFGSLEVVAHIRELWDGSYRSDRPHDFVECDTPRPLQVGGDVVGMRERTSAKLSKLPVRVVDYYSPPPT